MSSFAKGTSAAEGFKNSKSKICSGTIRQLAEEGFLDFKKNQIIRDKTTAVLLNILNIFLNNNLQKQTSWN
jgi:hypothetical protein